MAVSLFVAITNIAEIGILKLSKVYVCHMATSSYKTYFETKQSKNI
jgi:hypothetical protein